MALRAASAGLALVSPRRLRRVGRAAGSVGWAGRRRTLPAVNAPMVAVVAARRPRLAARPGDRRLGPGARAPGKVVVAVAARGSRLRPPRARARRARMGEPGPDWRGPRRCRAATATGTAATAATEQPSPTRQLRTSARRVAAVASGWVPAAVGSS